MHKTTATIRPQFKKHPLALAVHFACGAMLGAMPLAHAGPNGGTVVGGAGSISQSGLNTTVTQTSQNMAINWNSYNLQSNEKVQYIQPNSNSLSLNRILSNDGSTIAGRIDANGKVILVNPNGIFFTSTASLNVGSIIASGLDINPNDFMNGNLAFKAMDGTAGTVINSGMINASLGGNVALIGKQVKNDGMIVANLGTVSLASGKQAVLTFDEGGLLGVRVTEAILQQDIGVDPAVLNSGSIEAQGGRVLLTAAASRDVFSKAVNTTGAEQATSVVMNPDGSFSLVGGGDVVNSGTINTSATSAGQNGGEVALLGNNVTSSGVLKADAASGNAGEIELNSANMTLLTQNSLTSARSESNGVGGMVKVLGDKVGLFDQSTLDVSGANGGGSALIGGDYQGKNPYIRNASMTILNPDTRVLADALYKGNGGKVIAWSDGSTYFLGNISVKGGNLSGNGGFVETSGKEFLRFEGYADRTASNGNSGMLLLDPKNITVSATTGADDNRLPDITFSNGSGGSSSFTITASVLSTTLDGGNVSMQANNDISFNANVTSTVRATAAHGNLTLQAGRSITLASGVNISLNGGNFIATINDSGASSSNRDYVNGSPARFTMNSGSSITTKGGNIQIQAGNYSVPSVGADVGNFTLQTLNTSGTAGTSGANGGNAGSITVNNSYGDIIANGALTANGGNGDSSIDATLFLSNGGNGGTISLTARNIDLNAAVLSNGGQGYGDNSNSNLGLGGTGGNITSTITDANLTVSANVIALAGQNGDGTTSATGGAIQFNGDGGANTFTFNNAIDILGATRTVNGNGGTDTLVRGGNSVTNNTWTVSAMDAGTLAFGTSSIGFSGIANLIGGTAIDTFNVGANGYVRGFINGGGVSTAVGASPEDTVSLPANAIVSLRSSAPSPSTLIGNSAGNFTLYDIGYVSSSGANSELKGAGGPNDWGISGANIGNVGYSITTGSLTTRFSGFANLTGGGGRDVFTVSSGGYVAGRILGGGGGNDELDITALTSNVTVNVLASATSSITAGTATNFNVFSVETLSANTATNINNTLHGPDGSGTTNTWQIDSANGGTLNTNIGFTGFKTLNGGAAGGTNTGNDTFTIAAGSNFNGTINGGTGADTLTINLNGSETGTVNFNAGGNTGDGITIAGSGSGYNGTYTASAGQFASTVLYDRVAYTAGANTSTINFSGVRSIADNLQASSLRFLDDGNNIATVVDNAMLISNSSNSSASYRFSNKADLILSNYSQVNLGDVATNAVLTNANLTLQSVTSVSQANGTSLNAGGLMLDGVTAGADLNTNIGNLSVIGGTGAVSIFNQGNLTLGTINTASVANITADGIVTGTAALTSNAAFNVWSTGNITLSGSSNALSGLISLQQITGASFSELRAHTLDSAPSITARMNNTGATRFHNVNAGTLASDLTLNPINRAGNITNNSSGGGVFNVANLNMNTQGTITLRNIDHIDSGSLTASAVDLTTLNGITGLQTRTALLDVRNTLNDVSITNTGASSVSIVTGNGTTNGNITFNNIGDLTIRKLNAANDVLLPSAGTSLGDVTLTVAGVVSGNPATNITNTPSYKTVPDVVAGTFNASVSNGNIGSDIRPLGVFAINPIQISVPGHRAFIYTYGTFGGTEEIIVTAGDLSSYSDYKGATGQQLIAIDSLGGFDPAIFTPIRNYYYEDVAILMPADQRLDATDEEEQGTGKAGNVKNSQCKPQAAGADQEKSKDAATCDEQKADKKAQS